MTKREWERRLDSLESKLVGDTDISDVEFLGTSEDMDALNQPVTPPTATVSKDIDRVTTDIEGRQSETTETDSRTLTPREKAVMDVAFRPSDSLEKLGVDGLPTVNRRRETAETGDTGDSVDDDDGGTDTGDTDGTDGPVSHETPTSDRKRSAKVGTAKFPGRRKHERKRRQRQR